MNEGEEDEDPDDDDPDINFEVRSEKIPNIMIQSDTASVSSAAATNSVTTEATKPTRKRFSLSIKKGI